MTLVEFLTARLDEDEAVAQRAVRWNEGCRDWATDGEPDWEHIARHDPARVLREVEAKRDILNEWAAFSGIADNPGLPDDPALRLQVAVLWGVLARLALPYADHPAFKEEWRP